MCESITANKTVGYIQIMIKTLSELQKRADRADQSVLFFLAGANFLGKAREKLCYYVQWTICPWLISLMP